MEYRNLGRTGVKVSSFCLGTMNFGGRTDEKEASTIIDYAIDAGINFMGMIPPTLKLDVGAAKKLLVGH
jgi:aryl-alcohol dehydrogenase-like predicted oxidoreductase